MKKQRTVDVSEAVRDEPRVRKAMQQGVDAALQRRKQAGLPVAEWRHGKVVWIPAAKIENARPARRKASSDGANRASARAPKREPKKSASRSRRG